MIPGSFRTFLLLGIALLASGCNVFDGDTPTPAASPTASAGEPSTTQAPPSPTPVPLRLGDSVPMTWIQVTLPLPGDELLRPFEKRVAEEGRPGVDRWRVYTVEGAGAPALLHESRRWVTSADWADSGETVIISDWTVAEEPPAGEPLFILPGAQKLVPGLTDPVWKFQLPGGWYGWQSNADYAVVSHRSGGPYILLFGDGTAWQPQVGGQELEISGTSPDGRFLQFSSPAEYNSLTLQTSNLSLKFVAEPMGDAAVLAGKGLRAVFSPDASMLVLQDRQTLSFFDIAARMETQVPIPVAVQLGAPLSWSADGKYLIVNDGLLDVAVGAWLLQPTERELIDAALAPNAMRLGLTLSPNSSDAPCPEGALANRTLLVDVASGVETILFDCDRFFSGFNWVGDTHFITYTHTCWGCEGRSLPFFVSTTDGSVRQLADDFTSWSGYRVSPDGNSLLFLGPELRLYGLDGTLLRSISVEPGYAVIYASWKPDGSGFVYVVGPKDFVIL